MKQNANEQDEIVAEFKSFMYRAIVNCAHNVTRKIKRDEEINGGIPLETLDEKRFGEYIKTEDGHGMEAGIQIEFSDLRIRLNDDLIGALLAGLTEREVQSLILHEAFDYDYAQIGKMLGISPDRAKAYKYQGFVGIIPYYPAGCRITDFPGFYGFHTIKHYSALPHTDSLQKCCNLHLFVAILTSLKTKTLS